MVDIFTVEAVYSVDQEHESRILINIVNWCQMFFLRLPWQNVRDEFEGVSGGASRKCLLISESSQNVQIIPDSHVDWLIFYLKR